MAVLKEGRYHIDIVIFISVLSKSVDLHNKDIGFDFLLLCSVAFRKTLNKKI